MKNKFSIITVVKNDKNNILATLNSVKNQNYSNYEHLVLDGNSNDGTSSIIKNNLNKKIKYFRQKDKSLYHALNKGEAVIDASERDFYQGKLQAARFYIQWDLSATVQQSLLLEENNLVCFEMQDGWF